MVDVARNAGAVDGIFDGLSYVSSVIARQPDADGLSFLKTRQYQIQLLDEALHSILYQFIVLDF